MISNSAIDLLTIENLGVNIFVDKGIIHAVNDLSFTLKKGKTLAIVGESGSGKSILCKSIMGLLPRKAVISEKASIQFNGYGNLDRLSKNEFRGLRGREIAMIFQDPVTSLNPVMKIGRQIAEPLIYHKGLKRNKLHKKVIELMKSVEIPLPEQRFHQYPHQLSGGMCQRVAIAVALSCNPRLLIADEPTTALDVTVQSEILNLLAHRQSQKNMAMIIVTHDLAVAVGRADEIAVMYAGKIVEQAPAKDFVSHVRMPYTKALMDAIPHLDDPPHTPLLCIDGQPPGLLESGKTGKPIKGCSFAPRCSRARKKCRKFEPELTSDKSKTHLFACFYPLGEVCS